MIKLSVLTVEPSVLIVELSHTGTFIKIFIQALFVKILWLCTVRSSVIGTTLASSHMDLDERIKKITNQNFKLK